MRKYILLFTVLLIMTLNLNAAYFKAIPMTVSQPNGQEISCFASGDEFFNWLHDGNGFTMIQSPIDGYYYYAIKMNGTLAPSTYLVNSVDPSQVGITPWLKIPESEYQAKRALFNQQIMRDTKAPSTGTLNNIIIYIRFSDQDEFTTPRSVFDSKFNSSTPGVLSEHNYYEEVSYGQLSINSTHYPTCAITTNLSYQDSHPRDYYCPYNAVTNPIGYSGNEANTREQLLLKNAVTAIASQVPTTLNVDGDNNGKVDNVSFIIRGGNGAWADLIWAHRYWLNAEYAYINSKRVYDYTFEPESQNDVNTVCHEMFHAIGAPDLYHYSYDGYVPVGNWDIMESGTAHMGSYMKFRYGHWITLPTITSNGTYWLHPLSSANHNAYKIPCPTSSTQYFVVEYRKKEPGTYDYNIPGTGLIVYRINSQLDGLGNTNGSPDEVYIYRPGGTTSVTGDIGSAMFSSDYARGEFNESSNPTCFLSSGAAGNIFLHNISTCGDSISFTLNPELGSLPGVVTTNPPIDDLSVVSVTIGGQTFNPDASGHFNLDIYQGSYNLTANLEGYGEVNMDNVEVVPYVTSPTVHVTLQLLNSPYNLTHSISADSVYLNWNCNTDEESELDHYTIYISLNGTSFSGGRTTTDTHYAMHLTPNRDYWFYIRAIYDNGISFASNTIIANTTANDDPLVPSITAPELSQNYPNPFNPETLIKFAFPKAVTNPSLEIYNIKGEQIRSFNCQNRNEITWDGKTNTGDTAASGIYFYRLKSDQYTSQTRKMILMK